MPTSTSSNPGRRNGKAWKKKPGVSPRAHPGRTVHGRLPATIAARTAKSSSGVPA